MRRLVWIGGGVLALAAALVFGRLPDAPPPSPGGAPSVEFVAENIPVEAGSVIRFGFDPDDPSVRVIATLDPPGPPILLCGLAAPGDALPDRAQCTVAASGVRESVLRLERLGGLAIAVEGAGEASLALRLEFAERSRALVVLMPRIPAPSPGADCDDNACNPFFEVRPPRAGSFRAEARWSGGPASLVLLQGRVLARSYTATGLPYAIPARDQGPSPLGIASRLSAPGEYALAFVPDAGDEAATDVQITAVWP